MKRLRINRQQLKALRAARGWTVQMAAAHIGVSRQTIEYLERGVVRWPHPLTLERIAKTYEVALEEIVS